MNLAISGGRLIGKVYDAQEAAALPDAANASIAVVGLGRVGLPLAAAFAQSGNVAGYDIDAERVAALGRGEDAAGQCSGEEIRHSQLQLHASPERLGEADVIIVCVGVERRVDGKCHDDPLIEATRAVAANMKRGTVVVFESAVAPGTTEDRCIPLLCEVSGMRLHTDFHVGYAPERLGFGEPARRIGDVKKIVAGSSAGVSEFLVRLYGRVVKAGVVQAASIRAAEAAKVLENAQRDVNIALINEMMQLFDAMDIRVSDVVAAAGSKWNFHSYFPGLVGGRSLTVDPFHLVNAGRSHGLAMDIVAAARAVNERTSNFIADKLHAMLAPQARDLRGFRILVLGRSFKDNCGETENSKSFAVINSLWNRGADVYSYDPVARDGRFEGGRGAIVVDCVDDFAPYDAVVVTAAHDRFRKEFDVFRLAALAPRRAPVVDLRKLFDAELARLHFQYWTV